jgi:hypothetical protein
MNIHESTSTKPCLRLIIILLFLSSVGQTITANLAPAHFNPPTSNYRPMDAFIIGVKLNGADLVSGDEVALFDGSMCTGVGVVDHVASSGNPVSVIAYQAYGDDTGFIEGHTIIFKCWDASQVFEYAFSSGEVQYYDPATGSPISPKNFEGHASIMVSLNGSYSGACALTMQVYQAGWGATTPAVGTYAYPSGQVVNITATPAAGYKFVNWTGEVANPTSASTTVTMNINKTVCANFEQGSAGILGDVNDDAAANSTDGLIILSCDVGLNTAQFCPMNCGDVNADGLLNSTDGLIIMSNDVGISVSFPVGQPGCPQNVAPCWGCNP